MSVQPSQQADDEPPAPTRPTFVSSVSGAITSVRPDRAPGGGNAQPVPATAPAPTTAPATALAPATAPAPATAVRTTPATTPTAPTPATAPTTAPTTAPATALAPATTPAPATAPTPATAIRTTPATARMATTATASTADEPLLADAAGMRTSWLKVQAGFVDDPRAAVSDAADLIEQAAQALAASLRQRQRQLRVMWDQGTADGAPARAGSPAGRGSAGPGDIPDTEDLRLMMQRYRSLFNQICRS